MILFVNGPFSVGKTSAARILVEKIPDAVLYDPEVIGHLLQRIVGPVKKVKDFQDYALWRRLVVRVARGLTAVSTKTLVIPMTGWRRDLFDPIVAGLRWVDPDLWCFRLTASEPELAPYRVRRGRYGGVRVARLARRGLPERSTGPGFRGGSADGRPRARGGGGPRPEKRKQSDRLE